MTEHDVTNISGTQPRKNMITMGKVETSDLMMIITWAMDISLHDGVFPWGVSQYAASASKKKVAFISSKRFCYQKWVVFFSGNTKLVLYILSKLGDIHIDLRIGRWWGWGGWVGWGCGRHPNLDHHWFGNPLMRLLTISHSLIITDTIFVNSL